MTILRQYTLREMGIPFVLTLMLFTCIFLTGSLVKMADTVLNKGVGLLDVGKILILILPEVFSFTLPTSALAAVILAVGSFAQNNEFRAMKAMGINPIAIMIPVLVIAALISLFALAFNDQVVTAAGYAKRKLVKQILFKNPTALFSPNQFIKDFEGYIFHVKGIDGRRLEQVIIYQPQEDKPTRTIIAEHGEIMVSPSGDEITVRLYNGTIDEPEGEDLYKLDFETYTMPPISVESASMVQKKIRERRLSELLKRFGRGSTESEEDQLRHKSEFYKKISFSMATFVFVLVGLPVAILVRRGEMIWSFSISMSVVIAYYVLYIWADTVSNHGLLPPEIALWLPDVLLICVGSYLLKKAVVS